MKKYEEEIKETKDDLKKAKDAKNKIMELFVLESGDVVLLEMTLF